LTVLTGVIMLATPALRLSPATTGRLSATSNSSIPARDLRYIIPPPCLIDCCAAAIGASIDPFSVLPIIAGYRPIAKICVFQKSNIYSEAAVPAAAEKNIREDGSSLEHQRNWKTMPTWSSCRFKVNCSYVSSFF
jgi:hypothetical protein